MTICWMAKKRWCNANRGEETAEPKPERSSSSDDSLPWRINTGKSLIPLTLLFLAQKRNLLIPLELSRVMHQGIQEWDNIHVYARSL